MKKPKSAIESRLRPEPSGGTRITAPPLMVLHVDDDPNDTMLLQAAARKAGAPFVLHSVTDADQALAYFSGRGLYADRARYPMPALILLDLKMPRNTGFEVLKWIRSRPEFGHIPVVVLSGSELQDDIRQAYANGANSYLVKPLGFNDLVQLVTNINALWLTGAAAHTEQGAEFRA